MDSNTLLDYALFHLTPTRTRCDLVVFYGGKSEKLASGLVEPFVSHLKFAKDQILKGGYSITLRPPTADAFWFTKHTFQRFVRFVSTPEILERFIHIEREISQIASSIQSNEISSPSSAGHEEEGGSVATTGVTNKTPDSYKSKHKVEVADGAAPEENSKFRLQRLLGTRKLLLLKEQAMVYARAKAAGFGMDRMDELIYFSDAFGASRLREACTNFRDLNKQKHSDAQWMHELAAMEACPPNELSYLATSGITLAFENNDTNLGANGTNSDSIADKDSFVSHQTASTPPKIPLNLPWPNPGPQYMHNYQLPIQQYPPYHGYPIPGMHPYYPGHVHHPSTGLSRETSNYKSRKSSKKREKHANMEGSETSEEDEESESSISNSGTDNEEGKKRDKKHSPSERSYTRKNKKSSKTVVIRNINYITSKRRNGENGSSSEEADTLDEDAIKKHVADAVTSLDKHRHSKANKNKNGLEKDIAADISEGGERNENWNAFQSLLMSREESSPKAVSEKRTLDFEDQFSVNNSYNDSFTSGRIDLESEKVKVQHLTTDASIILTQRDGFDEGRINMVDMGNVGEINPSMKRRGSEDVELLPSRKIERSGSDSLGMISDIGGESSLIRNGNREDWFVVNRSEDLEIHETKHSNFYERKNLSSEKDWSHMEGYKSIDDSLMVQSRPAFDDQRDSEWKTDISMVADLTMASPSVNGGPKDVSGTQAPDDLCVVLVRDSMDSTGSWTREMDYGIENSYTEANRRSSVVETNGDIEETQDVECKSANGKKGTSPAMKSSGKDMRSKLLQGSLARSNADNSLKSKKTFPASRLMGQRSKYEKEDDMRKRLEELTIQRQKRIAERTAATKKVQTGSKSASAKPKTIPMNSGKDVKNQLKKTSLKANGLVRA